MRTQSQRLAPKRRLLTVLRFLIRRLRGPQPVTFPPLDPQLLPPMQAKVEIIRDSRGIPHVYAQCEEDLYAALGYLMAADRFTLLDLVRHLGAGRLTELIGNLRFPANNPMLPGRSLFDVDAFVRPLGFEAASTRDYEAAPARAQAVLQAFANGINSALRAMNGCYPIDHVLFGPVRPWQPADALLAARTCAFCVSLAPLDIELAVDAARSAVGDDVARRLFPEAPWDEAPSNVPGFVSEPEPPLYLDGVGSNNWAVSSTRSASGKPIFANDPHVPFFPLPTFWYHAHVECPTYRAQGGMLPGCPVFPFGHNGFLAWGVTTAYRDAWDLFRIHRLPGKPHKYRTPTGEGTIQQHREHHIVRLGRDKVLEWESCAHGVIYPGWKHHDGVDLALRYVPSDTGAFVHGFLRLLEARTVAEHRAALEEIHLGPFDFNHVYAHVDGTIGWEVYGQSPIRTYSGLFVRDAQDPKSEWTALRQFSASPKKISPPGGFVATANSFTDEEQNWTISTPTHAEPLYRQRRIEAFLSQHHRHSVQTFASLQSDIGSEYGIPLRDVLCNYLASRYAQHYGVRGRAYRALREWTGQYETNAVGPSILAWLQRDLAELCFLPLLGAKAGYHFIRTRRAIPRLHRVLLNPNDALRPDIERAAQQPLENLVARAFEHTVQRLQRSFGDDVQTWTWGRVHRLRLSLWCGELPLIGRWFRALDDSFPGDLYTVSPSVSFPLGTTLRALVGATSRFICDLAEPEVAYFAHTSGPSGDSTSAFFRSTTRAWRQFEYFKCGLWSPEDIPHPVERVVVVARGPSSPR